MIKKLKSISTFQVVILPPANSLWMQMWSNYSEAGKEKLPSKKNHLSTPLQEVIQEQGKKSEKSISGSMHSVIF